MLASVGHSCEEAADYDWRGMERPERNMALFQLTLAGEGVLETPGGTIPQRPGSAMLLTIPGRHRYRFDPGRATSWEFLYLCFTGRELLRVWREIEARTGGSLRLEQGSQTGAMAADLLSRAAGHRIATPYEASSLAYRFAMQAASEALGGPERARSEDPAMARARRLAEEGYRSGLNVASLAEACGMSRFHFTRRFKAACGLSPSRFLATLRAREAARRLKNTNQSVKEIAFACGFYDANHFAKAFRKETGYAPSEYRAAGML